MAKEEKKRCKECEGKGEDCKCPDKKKKNKVTFVGYYGLEKDDSDDKDMSQDDPMATSGDGGGTMGEAVKMPRAPQETDKHMQGISAQKKKKKLDDFKAQVEDAKKRQRDEDRKSELRAERRTKGIRFYDSKGSGYIKNGKKEYD